MGVKEAAAYLSARGYECGVGTVRALAKAGQIPAYRPGVSGRGSYRFTAEQLDRFLVRAEWGGQGGEVRRPAPPRVRKPRLEAAVKSDWEKDLKAEIGS